MPWAEMYSKGFIPNKLVRGDCVWRVWRVRSASSSWRRAQRAELTDYDVRARSYVHGVPNNRNSGSVVLLLPPLNKSVVQRRQPLEKDGVPRIRLGCMKPFSKGTTEAWLNVELEALSEWIPISIAVVVEVELQEVGVVALIRLSETKRRAKSEVTDLVRQASTL